MRPLELGARPRILIVRLSAIGDVVVTTPVARALRQALPKAYLAWAVDEKAADVVIGNPNLDEVFVWQRGGSPAFFAGGHGLGRGMVSRPREGDQRDGLLPGGDSLGWSSREAALFAELRSRRFDVAIDFQGLARSACLAALTGAPHRIGRSPSREGSGLFYTIRVPGSGNPSSRQRCLDMLRPLGIESEDRQMQVPILPEDRAFAAVFLEQHGLEQASYVCLCPATTWPNKHWFEERWARLADALRQRLGLCPLFMGSRADLPLLDRIQAEMRTSPVIAAGATSLRGAAALLEGAGAAVSVDTALMHIGVAVGTPVVGLCGPSYWPGFQDYEQYHMIRKPVPCSPCLRHPTCAHFDCMRAIGVEEALQAVAGMGCLKREGAVA